MNNIFFVESGKKSLLYVRYVENIDDGKTNFGSYKNSEIILFISGKGYIQTSDERIPVKKMDMAIVNKNTIHSEVNDGLTYIALGINTTSFYFLDLQTQKIKVVSLNDEEYGFMYSEFNSIYLEAFNKNEFKYEIIDNCYNNIECMMKRKINLIFFNSKENKYSDLVESIKSYIETNYYKNINLTELASIFKQSVSSLCHKFKDEMGKSIIEYKLEMQVLKAKELLTISDMQVSEVADITGFNSVSYFSECFKRKYNISPKNYKSQFK